MKISRTNFPNSKQFSNYNVQFSNRTLDMTKAPVLFDLLPDVAKLPRHELRPELMDLSRFQRFLDRVGNPERGLPVIHVGGSKGKGSTAALIAGGLIALGKRVGVFISPYLHSPTQSIFLNGRAIEDSAFEQYLERYESILKTLPPTELISQFELLTALALQYFHDQDVDFAVMEVGLGGRLDATNAVESPVVSVITPIEKEHTELLGNSIASISYEKFGIIREKTPFVVAPQSDSFVLDFARSVSLQKRAPCVLVGSKYRASILHRSTEGYSFRLETPSRLIPKVTLALLGDHQVDNATTAWAVLDQLLPEFDPVKVADVWANLTLPGRFELTVKEGREVVLDGAHTINSAKGLRKTLDQLYGGEPITFILSFLDDKSVEGFVQHLVRWGDAVVLTQVDHPRALPARVIEERFHTVWPRDRITTAITNNVRVAWQKACKLAGRGPICVSGSFKLIEGI